MSVFKVDVVKGGNEWTCKTVPVFGIVILPTGSSARCCNFPPKNCDLLNLFSPTISSVSLLSHLFCSLNHFTCSFLSICLGLPAVFCCTAHNPSCFPLFPVSIPLFPEGLKCTFLRNIDSTIPNCMTSHSR